MATSQRVTSGRCGTRCSAQFALRLQPIVEVVSIFPGSRAVKLERATGDVAFGPVG